ncbi:cytochrome P450, partial [Auriscalpium vulgare]
LVVVICAYVLNAVHVRRKRSRLPYPPGPRGLPLIGNLLDLPSDKGSWLAYTELGKKYGDIFSLNILGQLIIVVQSPKIAYDLLEKRSNIYSDRIPSPTSFNRAGWHWYLAIAGVGAPWRIGRRILDRSMRPSAIVNYRPAQIMKVHAFLNHLLHDPENFADHIEYLQDSLIMNLGYGIYIKGHDDEYLAGIKRTEHMMEATTLPGSVAVNLLPFLRYLPEWLSG